MVRNFIMAAMEAALMCSSLGKSALLMWASHFFQFSKGPFKMRCHRSDSKSNDLVYTGIYAVRWLAFASWQFQ